MPLQQTPASPATAARTPRTVVVGIDAVLPEDVVAVARDGAAVELSSAAAAEIRRSRAVVDALAGDDEPHYGISTGFGALATTHIPPARRAQLQRSLIRSHAAGSGPEVEREVVRALMLLRLSTLATGRTGVRLETVRAYAAVSGWMPVWPVASVESRSSIIARTTSRSTSGPVPAAWLRTRLRWSAARRSGAMWRVASAPNPVETP